MVIWQVLIITGLGLTQDRLGGQGGQVAQAWPGFSKAWLYHDFGPPPEVL